MWLGLRRTDGICLRSLGERLGIDVADLFTEPIEKLLSEGLVAREGDQLSLTEHGQVFGNTVGEEFLTH